MFRMETILYASDEKKCKVNVENYFKHLAHHLKLLLEVSRFDCVQCLQCYAARCQTNDRLIERMIN